MVAFNSASVAVARDNFLFPRYRYTSSREKAVLSVVIPVYSPGCRRNKKAMQIISARDISKRLGMSAS